MEEKGDVATVIDDELRAFTFWVEDGLPSAIPILLEGLTLPSEDGNPGGCDCRGGLVLRGEDIAAGPTDIGTKVDKGFDEHGRLDCHVQGASDANTSEGLVLGVFFADRHQSGHLFFGNFDLFTTEFGKGDVLDLIFGKLFLGFALFCFRLEGCGAHVWFLLWGLVTSGMTTELTDTVRMLPRGVGRFSPVAKVAVVGCF